jgi:hypothetical protein
MMRTTYSILVVLSIALAASAQQSASGSMKAQGEDLGWTSSMSFEGSVDSSERVLDLNSSVGYNFTKNWGADVGVPFTFVSASTSSTTTTTGTTGKAAGGSTSLNSVGNVFADLRFNAKGSVANYSSTITVGAPTGSTKHGVSTGRPNYGWNNHVEHDFDRLTPFIEAGFSNGLTDTKLFHRPFTSLGFVSQFAGGTTIDLGHDFSLGGSLYDVLPSGTQKVFSKLVSKTNGQAAGKGTHGRSWELAAETVGDSSLTRDNGGSVWFDYSPGAFDFQVGYTHSVHYALDTVAFSLGVNLGKLAKNSSRY